MPEISVVVIEKEIIFSGDGKTPDAIAVQDIYLHTVIGDKQMPAALHDLALGVIKQVVNVEFENIYR